MNWAEHKMGVDRFVKGTYLPKSDIGDYAPTRLTYFGTGETINYAIFARMVNTNSSGNGHATFLVAGIGNFGGYTQGVYLVTISNRSKKATVKVTALSPQDNGTSTFGYYESNGYFYFGVCTSQYRGAMSITTIQNVGAEVSKFSDIVNTPPSGWTTVTSNTVLRTGDKPSGTYTGNGSGTSRTINVGGIGTELLIRCKFGISIISSDMYFTITNSSDAICGNSIGSFRDGVLTLTTTSSYLNGNQTTYYYKVL